MRTISSFFEDDFEAILETLESDEGLEKQFVSAVSEVSVKILYTENNILAWFRLYRESMQTIFCLHVGSRTRG